MYLYPAAVWTSDQVGGPPDQLFTKTVVGIVFVVEVSVVMQSSTIDNPSAVFAQLMEVLSVIMPKTIVTATCWGK